MQEPQHLTTAQVAARLGLARKTLEAWRRGGAGPPWVRLGARTIRYPTADLEAWERRQPRAPIVANPSPREPDEPRP